MWLRSLAVIALCLVFAPRANACSFEPRPLEESFAGAKQSFIGTVTTVENRLAILKVEKAMKGTKDGDEVNVEIDGSSCAIRFQPGQRWLYLGPGQPDGSLLLQDEMGRSMDDNLKAVADKLKLEIPDSSEVITGTAEGSCAPWDGAAFMLTLANGITAMGYTRLEQGGATMTYAADGKPERGHGSISQCPQNTERDQSQRPCATPKGTIFIGGFDGKNVRGAIETEDGEHHSRYVFKLQWLQKQVFCG